MTPGAGLPTANRRGPPLPAPPSGRHPAGFHELEQSENNTGADGSQRVWIAKRCDPYDRQADAALAPPSVTPVLRLVAVTCGTGRCWRKRVTSHGDALELTD